MQQRVMQRYGDNLRDHDDITRAVEVHADTVLRVCTLYFKASPERDDAFQETFIKYARSDASFADDEHRKAWLITVARNTCKDLLKRADAKTLPLEAAGDVEAPGAQPAMEGMAGELEEALAQLEEPYRIVLYLKYYEGYPAADIASLLGMPENTVYTNLARGKKKLKEVLTHDR